MKSCEKKFLLFFVIHSITAIVVELDDGLIEGVSLQTRKGANYFAFRGIPFAEPPIGDLRFKAPVKKEKWNGTLDATEYGPRCPQITIGGSFAGVEDCLQLNVCTKTLSSGVLKPVIVFVHGGAFEVGSGVSFQPNMLLDRDVVFVAMNYRLGPFGFLATGTADAPGNYAMKDQNLALKWVQQNIEKFDGDPNKVTLAGNSAGSHSVTAHLASEMSNGLFHRVIASSGAITWQVGIDEHHLEEAQKLATNVGCPNEVDTMVECLKTKTAEEISRGSQFDFYGCPILTWVPVVESDFGQERFLTEDPNILFRAGNFTKVPIIAGITEIEFAMPIAEILNNPETAQELNDNFTLFASKCFNFKDNGRGSLDFMSNSLRNLYLPFVDVIDKRNFNGLSMLSADGVIGYGVHRFVHFTSTLTDVFYYKFSFAGRNSMFKYPRDRPYGVHHTDDVQYVLSSDFMNSQIEETDPENVMVERMTRIWENFAKNGNPHDATDEYLKDMNWPKHNASEEFYLDIGTFMVEKQGLYLERFAVWDNFETAASGKLRVGWVAMVVAVVMTVGIVF